MTPGPDDPATTSSGAELTGEEAVEFLNVSREHLVRLLDAGEIPQHWTEQGRRLRQADLVAYRERRHQESLEALRALADLSQEHDLGY